MKILLRQGGNSGGVSGFIHKIGISRVLVVKGMAGTPKVGFRRDEDTP